MRPVPNRLIAAVLALACLAALGPAAPAEAARHARAHVASALRAHAPHRAYKRVAVRRPASRQALHKARLAAAARAAGKRRAAQAAKAQAAEAAWAARVARAIRAANAGKLAKAPKPAKLAVPTARKPIAHAAGAVAGGAVAASLATALTVQAEKVLQPYVARELTDGVIHFRQYRKTKAGPMAINVLRVDPRRVDIKSLVVQRKGGGFGRAKVSAIAKAYGALAAINGSFFSFKNNEPTGLMVVDGQIVSSSRYNRSVFGLRYDGTPFIDNARVRASVLLDDGRELPISRVNHAPGPNELNLYTPHFGRTTRTRIEPWRYEVAIDQTGTVIEVANGDLPIPRGGYVISANGSAYKPLVGALQPGSRALVYTQLSGEWEGVRYAVGGGPTILKDGKVQITAKQEAFGSHIASGRAPRTAIGYTRSGDALMVTVDGRQPKYSIGCTLNELARLMQSLGAYEAMNLDGGGSSTMVVEGKTVNKVSAGTERLVSNAIGVFPRAE
jgi:exopolysaccharide biosynthesis protein